MMRMRPVIPRVNWQYAVGECVLIVLGIMIALGLNGWSQNRRDRRAEVGLLREMRTALAENLADNRTDYEAFKQAHARLARLADHLQQRKPHTARVDSLFGALILTRTLQRNSGPYEVLRARGFELLSDDSLRARVVHFYGITYPFIATRYTRVDEFVQEYSQPYFLQNFRGTTRFGGPVTAVSYEHVARDLYFANLVTLHLAALNLLRSSYEEALNEGLALLEALDRQIANLE
jgi:hypothetical protein